jgi:Hexokinase
MRSASTGGEPRPCSCRLGLNTGTPSGSLYQHYPGFEESMREALRILLGEEVEKRVEMGLAKDGSGVGGTFPSLSCLAFVLRSYYADIPLAFSAALGALQATKHNKV